MRHDEEAKAKPKELIDPSARPFAPEQTVPPHWRDRRVERLNALTHGGMAGLLLLLLIMQLYLPAIRPVHWSDWVFLLCLLSLFILSALYHGLPSVGRWKHHLNRLDHMVIYWAIAGTYTPVALTLIRGSAGHLILALQWSLVLIGMLFKIFAFRKGRLAEILSVVLYVLMGWMIVFFLPALPEHLSPAFWACMVAGGLFYTIGIVFFSMPGRYSHVVWHLFVSGGAVSHLLALLVFR